MKKVKFQTQCPNCKKWISTPLIRHHIIDKYFKRFLIEVCDFDKKQIELLRRQLTVRLCGECEDLQHTMNVYKLSLEHYT